MLFCLLFYKLCRHVNLDCFVLFRLLLSVSLFFSEVEHLRLSCRVVNDRGLQIEKLALKHK